MACVREAIVEAAVTVDIVDVGGGFPSSYPGMEPPPLETYFAVIHQAFEALPISYSAELWCEPGRALCAEYASVLVRVEKRRGDELYINDGAYGALFDAAHVAWRFPVRALEDDLTQPLAEFAFYGPTCDDADYMKGPFMGLRVETRRRGESLLVIGTPATPDLLTFDSVTTVDAKVFADLGQLFPRATPLRDTRITLAVDNLFNDRQRVTNNANVTPQAYQPVYRDPIGRTLLVEIRKVF